MILISYTETVWRESGMTTQNKVDGLTNLDGGIYDGAATYLTTLTHVALYYTKGECDAKYFTSATDGAGTGLVCERLDGYSSRQIIDAGTPAGCIGIWPGSEVSIPAGWLLCDGTNSTPNLQDRFIVGAGGNYSYGAIGGSDTVTTSATITIAGHALTAAEIPLHTHSNITDYYMGTTTNHVPEIGYAGPYSTGSAGANRTTGYTGNNDSHSHTASFAGTASQDKRGPWSAYCYIMKS